MKLWKLAGLLVMVGVMLLSSGCCCVCGTFPFRRDPLRGSVRRVMRVSAMDVGELRTERTTLPLDKAESVRATVSMEVGELSLRGGAQGMLEAEFTYNVDAWKPEIRSQVRDGVADLSVRQPNVRGLSVAEGARNEWNLRLPDEVPLELWVNGGVGTHDLRLSGLGLTRLEVNVGVGEMRLDLSGDWQRDVDVTINGGVGRAVIRLPRATGARVEVDGGLGSVRAGGLRRDGDAYVNDAYGETDHTLHIQVRGGIGEVVLEGE